MSGVSNRHRCSIAAYGQPCGIRSCERRKVLPRTIEEPVCGDDCIGTEAPEANLVDVVDGAAVYDDTRSGRRGSHDLIGASFVRAHHGYSDGTIERKGDGAVPRLLRVRHEQRPILRWTEQTEGGTPGGVDRVREGMCLRHTPAQMGLVRCWAEDL